MVTAVGISGYGYSGLLDRWQRTLETLVLAEYD